MDFKFKATVKEAKVDVVKDKPRLSVCLETGEGDIWLSGGEDILKDFQQAFGLKKPGLPPVQQFGRDPKTITEKNPRGDHYPLKSYTVTVNVKPDEEAGTEVEPAPPSPQPGRR